MKVVILAGGLGSRIRDVSEDIPKPMISIGTEPILIHIMKYFSTFGFKDFIICLGYKGHIIKDYFLNYSNKTRDITLNLSTGKIIYHQDIKKYNWNISLINTGHYNMTGSRISQIRDYIGDEDFFLTYGDGVGDIDLKKLLKFHKEHKKILTVTGVRPPGRFGEISKNDDGLAIGFNEKPQTSNGRISGGFFVAKPSIFDFLSNSKELVFEEQPINSILNKKELMVYEHNGFWQPMDTSREFKLLNELYKKGEAPWVSWE
ncbi:glucose-1-phosphate cytidylyltransferase [Alphaproteobacteria bacterium]|nr:glucose-1-phosphate cytidylyltransferase [Alphaproteobacteria bacterium]